MKKLSGNSIVESMKDYLNKAGASNIVSARTHKLYVVMGDESDGSSVFTVVPSNIQLCRPETISGLTMPIYRFNVSKGAMGGYGVNEIASILIDNKKTQEVFNNENKVLMAIFDMIATIGNNAARYYIMNGHTFDCEETFDKSTANRMLTYVMTGDDRIVDCKPYTVVVLNAIPIYSEEFNQLKSKGEMEREAAIAVSGLLDKKEKVRNFGDEYTDRFNFGYDMYETHNKIMSMAKDSGEFNTDENGNIVIDSKEEITKLVHMLKK